jgi:hypothetical protein
MLSPSVLRARSGFGPRVAVPDASDLKEKTMAPNDNRTHKEQREQLQPEPTEPMKQSNPPRSNVHPEQTAEVPHGTGNHAEPPGGGGRPSQRQRPDDTRKP